MSSYVWATPRKAFEYYLQDAGRTPADLWRSAYDGHVRISIMDVEFSGDQIRALLALLQKDVPESDRKYELPIWMAVHVDDVERTLCGAKLPTARLGRPTKNLRQANRDYHLAVEVSKLLSNATASSVADAARILIGEGRVDGASHEAKMKKVQRVYCRYFRLD